MDVHEKRIVGINVSPIHCKHFDTPSECPYGVDCFYRHAGDTDQSEYKQSKEKAKSEAPKEPSAPKVPREPRRWAPLKPVTPVRIGDDASFPALGAAKVEDHSDLKAIFTVPKRPAEAVSESTEQEDVEVEGDVAETVEEVGGGNDEVDEDNDNAINDAIDAAIEEESENVRQEDPNTPPATQSRIHASDASLVTVSSEDAGEWISDATLSSFEQNLRGATQTPSKEESRRGNAALCTGDFAMQNVSLQMNLPLLSYANRRISQLRVHTRRCRDCFA